MDTQAASMVSMNSPPFLQVQLFQFRSTRLSPQGEKGFIHRQIILTDFGLSDTAGYEINRLRDSAQRFEILAHEHE